MELKENHLKILLYLLPVVLYISSFSFWSGYLSNLNIEYFNFNLDPNLIIKAFIETNMKIFMLMLLISLIFVILVGYKEFQRFNGPVKNVADSFIPIPIALVIGFGIILFNRNIDTPSRKLLFSALTNIFILLVIIFLVNTIFLFCMYRFYPKYWKSYWVRRKEMMDSVKGKLLYLTDKFQTRMQISTVVAFSTLLLIPLFFYLLGTNNFMDKTEWSVYNDKCVISFQDASNAYCNEFSETDKTISKTYTIINKNDLKDKISTKNLGKLTVKD
ncbi:MAG: hypothetical protein WCK98_04240 [bacterium]